MEEYPILAFYFRVEINGTEISFQEVSGLKAKVGFAKYRHGDSENFHAINVPGIVEFDPLVCRKGLIEDDENLTELFNDMFEEKAYYNQEDKFDMEVEVLNPDGEVVMAYLIEGAFPEEISGPKLNALANEIAIEEMVFRYDSMKVSNDGA